jgi:hypothetical protein
MISPCSHLAQRVSKFLLNFTIAALSVVLLLTSAVDFAVDGV